MMKIKNITINPCREGLIASVVVWESSVSLNEEDGIRKMLVRFYTTRTDLVRPAVRVDGTRILFQVRPNCKHPHTEEDIEAMLKATNCYPADEKPKRAAIKKGGAIRRHSLQVALV